MNRGQLDELARDLGAARPGPGPRPFDALDSIAKLELILAVERESGIEFSDEELAGIESLDQLEAALARPRAAPGEAPAAAAVGAARTPPPPRSPWATRVLLLAAVRLLARIRVEGAEHLPPSGPFLVGANHASHLDGLALFVAGGRRRADLVFPAARDYFFSGRRRAEFARRLIPLLPFERAGRVTALRQNLAQLESCRDEGRGIVLFPEGTRSRTGELGAFMDGPALFATRLGLSAIPCWIDGTYRALPAGARWPRPGRISVAFGPPVPPAASAEAFNAALRRAMLALRPASGP